ncbi:MAG: serine/threonine protein phosphatase [Clostridiales bacterium]|nr:serine/threonine protein phosphatase [Clostridiales bacterium]
MLSANHLTKAFKSSKEIEINSSSKIILMSDVHRGNYNWSDNFANNSNIYYTALNHYFNKGFTYIEIGDGDELWQNRHFPEIRQSHSDIFKLLRKFYLENRLYLIYGNHDMVKKNEKFVKENLYYYYNEREKKNEPLFVNIKCYEGLILKYKNKKIFVVHGHQGDLLNDHFWWVARFLARYIWTPLELYLGFKDITSPAKNFTKKKSTEERITNWAKKNNQMVITGHTHRPMFPIMEKSLYFNTGSCVHPRSITGIEIENGLMTLIKWNIKTDANNYLHVNREPLTDPQRLEFFIQRMNK